MQATMNVGSSFVLRSRIVGLPVFLDLDGRVGFGFVRQLERQKLFDALHAQQLVLRRALLERHAVDLAPLAVHLTGPLTLAQKCHFDHVWTLKNGRGRKLRLFLPVYSAAFVATACLLPLSVRATFHAGYQPRGVRHSTLRM